MLRHGCLYPTAQVETGRTAGSVKLGSRSVVVDSRRLALALSRCKDTAADFMHMSGHVHEIGSLE